MPSQFVGLGGAPAQGVVLFAAGGEKGFFFFVVFAVQPREERVEWRVIGGKLGDVSRLAGTEGALGANGVVVVGVGNVEIDDWNARFQQRRHVTERLRRRRIKAGEAREGGGDVPIVVGNDVGDDVAVEIQDRGLGVDRR